MKVVHFIFIIGLFVLVSCAEKAGSVEYTLTDEQLSNLMLDMQLAEVTMGEVNGLERDSLKSAFEVRLETLYKHPVSVLENDIRTLESDPEKLTLVMDRVQVLLDSLR